MKKIYRILAAVLCFAVCVMLFSGCAMTQGQAVLNMEDDGLGFATLVTDQAKIPSIETVDPLLSEVLDATIGSVLSVNGRCFVIGRSVLYEVVSFVPGVTELDESPFNFPQNLAVTESLPENESYLQIPLRILDVGEETLYLHWQTMRTQETENGQEILKSTDRLSPLQNQTIVTTGGHFRGKVLEDRFLRYLTTTAGTVWYESSDETDATVPRILTGVTAKDVTRIVEIELPANTVVHTAQPLAGDRLLVQLMDIQTSGTGYTTVDGSSRFYLLDLTQKKPELGAPLLLPEGFLANGTPVLLGHDLGDLPAQASVYTPAGVYRWDVDSAVFTLLYSAGSMGGGLTAAMNDAILYTDGTLCVPYQSSYDQSLRLRMFYPTDGTRADDRQVITVGGASIDDTLRQAVDAFNWSNTEYRVKLLDYSDAAAVEQGFANGMEMLQRQLIQGEGPDVVLLSETMSAGDLLNKGLFVDLYPLIDADEELSRDDLVPSVLNACETDGTLPLVPPAFGILSAVGSAQRLGTDMGWTWAEFDAVTAGCSTPYYGLDRLNLLWFQLQMEGERFLDYAAGIAHFDDPAFVRMLEDSARYPAQMHYGTDIKQKISSGETMLNVFYGHSIDQTVLETYYFDGLIVYKGFPTEDGSIGSAFEADYQVGIRSTGDQVAAAWLFVRTLLLPEFQDALANASSGQIPLRLDSIQKLMERKQQDEQMYFSYPPEIPMPPTEEQMRYFSRGLTLQECDDFMALILATNAIFRFDSAVYSIVAEEADAFYSGIRTAEEAAKLIQSRVQTYLAEQG